MIPEVEAALERTKNTMDIGQGVALRFAVRVIDIGIRLGHPPEWARDKITEYETKIRSVR